MNPPFIVGISGGSGSGKTYIASSLIKAFTPGEICFICQDNYYKKRELVPKDIQGVENFDTLDAIDFKAFLTDLKKLIRGEKVEIREYTFNHPEKTPALLTLRPAPVILVEGIFLFAVEEIFNLLDLKIFIDASDVVKIKRRILRDSVERGYDFHDVFYRYEKHVSPAYEKYIYPFIGKADLVIPSHENVDMAVKVLYGYLRSRIDGA